MNLPSVPVTLFLITLVAILIVFTGSYEDDATGQIALNGLFALAGAALTRALDNDASKP